MAAQRGQKRQRTSYWKEEKWNIADLAQDLIGKVLAKNAKDPDTRRKLVEAMYNTLSYELDAYADRDKEREKHEKMQLVKHKRTPANSCGHKEGGTWPREACTEECGCDRYKCAVPGCNCPGCPTCDEGHPVYRLVGGNWGPEPSRNPLYGVRYGERCSFVDFEDKERMAQASTSPFGQDI